MKWKRRYIFIDVLVLSKLHFCLLQVFSFFLQTDLSDYFSYAMSNSPFTPSIKMCFGWLDCSQIGLYHMKVGYRCKCTQDAFTTDCDPISQTTYRGSQGHIVKMELIMNFIQSALYHGNLEQLKLLWMCLEHRSYKLDYSLTLGQNISQGSAKMCKIVYRSSIIRYAKYVRISNWIRSDSLQICTHTETVWVCKCVEVLLLTLYKGFCGLSGVTSSQQLFA